MDKYRTIRTLGDGTFGSVTMATVKGTKEVVAIKKLKRTFGSWEECNELREISILRKICHPNIIKLREIIREADDLYLVMDYMQQNLLDLITRDVQMDLPFIKNIMRQVFEGLAYIHKSSIIHRDIKPENILVSQNSCKIGDFGIAKDLRNGQPFTDYVSTRWYRAPEQLLRSQRYSWPADIFAAGCVLAEIFLKRPIFPGTNEQDQLMKICEILGTPTIDSWPEFPQLSRRLGITLPRNPPVPLQEVIPSAPLEAISFLSRILCWDPSKRSSATQCLNHPFLQSSQRETFPIFSEQVEEVKTPTNSRNSYGRRSFK